MLQLMLYLVVEALTILFTLILNLISIRVNRSSGSVALKNTKGPLYLVMILASFNIYLYFSSVIIRYASSKKTVNLILLEFNSYRQSQKLGSIIFSTLRSSRLLLGQVKLVNISLLNPSSLALLSKSAFKLTRGVITINLLLGNIKLDRQNSRLLLLPVLLIKVTKGIRFAISLIIDLYSPLLNLALGSFSNSLRLLSRLLISLFNSTLYSSLQTFIFIGLSPVRLSSRELERPIALVSTILLVSIALAQIRLASVELVLKVNLSLLGTIGGLLLLLIVTLDLLRACLVPLDTIAAPNLKYVKYLRQNQ